MRFVICLLLSAVISSAVHAQQLGMSCDGKVTPVLTDLDASAYAPVRDINDNLCALIKVTVTNTLKNPLMLDVGGLAVMQREEKENGEIWFYVPSQVKNLIFSCKDYTPVPPVPVRLQPGKVYRLTIVSDAVVSTVTNAVISTNFLKIRTVPQDVTLKLWDAAGDLIADEILSDGNFARQLDYGTYRYRAEHGMYKMEEGVLTVSSSNETYEVELAPDYGILKVESVPESGADVYVNQRKVGKTPLSEGVKIKSGTCTVRVQMKDYYSEEQTVKIKGDGAEQWVIFDMKAQYAEITCTSSDPEAEIWVDNVRRGTGSWTGRLSSSVSHVLEARRDNHQSQSISFTVRDGEHSVKEVGAPVPLYASLTVQTEPSYCTVYVDGKEIGESPLVSQVLMGRHEVSVSCDGYEPESKEVILEHNESRELSFTLAEKLLEPEGRLTVEANRKKAVVYVDNVLKGVTPVSFTLPAGSYYVNVSKSGYSSSPKYVRLEDGDDKSIYFNLEKSSAGRYAQKSFPTHHVEFLMGLDTDDTEFMLGGSYAWVKKRVGGYGSFMAGLNNGGVSLVAGPVLRLSPERSVMDFQIYGGAGIMASGGVNVAGDFGIRIGGKTKRNFAWWSFSAGGMTYGGHFVVTMGFSVGLMLVAVGGAAAVAVGA